MARTWLDWVPVIGVDRRFAAAIVAWARRRVDVAPDEVAVPTGASTRASEWKSLAYVDGTVALAAMGSTNVVVELVEPREVDLGGRRGVRPVHTARFDADDPAAAVHVLREAAGRAEAA